MEKTEEGHKMEGQGEKREGGVGEKGGKELRGEEGA